MIARAKLEPTPHDVTWAREIVTDWNLYKGIVWKQAGEILGKEVARLEASNAALLDALEELVNAVDPKVPRRYKQDCPLEGYFVDPVKNAREAIKAARGGK